MVVLTVLRAIKGETYDKVHLYKLKWSIAKRLLELNYDKNKLNALFIFMNYYLSFDNVEENVKFAEEFAKKNHLISNNMGIREIVAQEYGKELIEYGREEGREEGMALKTISGVLKAEQKGINHVDIAFLFDISVKEVEEILENHKK